MKTPHFFSALTAYLVGEDDRTPPPLPDGLPSGLTTIVARALTDLTLYQNADYARLYLHRLSRYVKRIDLTHETLERLAQYLAIRMLADDPVALARKVRHHTAASPRPKYTLRMALAELVSLQPATLAELILEALALAKWSDRIVTITLGGASWGGRLLAWIFTGGRRFRPLTLAHRTQQASIERWLHMVDRALAKRPDAVGAIIRSAELLTGYGEGYRASLAAWNAIIDGVAKPGFDGKLHVPDLSGALDQLFAIAQTKPDLTALQTEIEKQRDSVEAAS